MRSSVFTVLIVAVFAAGCSGVASPTAPSPSLQVSPMAAAPLSAGVTVQPSSRNQHACWGEATQVFAQMGELGAHASEQATPRLGLRNVARALFELGIIADDSLQALGAFLSAALGLSIESCL